MDKQRPSIGRVVHYLSRGSKDGFYQPESRAAIVTEVQTAEVVSLCILNPTGMFFTQNVSYGGEPGQWIWPPFVHPEKQKEAN
jgi:hypothetical protein